MSFKSLFKGIVRIALPVAGTLIPGVGTVLGAAMGGALAAGITGRGSLINRMAFGGITGALGGAMGGGLSNQVFAKFGTGILNAGIPGVATMLGSQALGGLGAGFATNYSLRADDKQHFAKLGAIRANNLAMSDAQIKDALAMGEGIAKGSFAEAQARGHQAAEELMLQGLGSDLSANVVKDAFHEMQFDKSRNRTRRREVNEFNFKLFQGDVPKKKSSSLGQTTGDSIRIFSGV